MRIDGFDYVHGGYFVGQSNLESTFAWDGIMCEIDGLRERKEGDIHGWRN